MPTQTRRAFAAGSVALAAMLGRMRASEAAASPPRSRAPRSLVMARLPGPAASPVALPDGSVAVIAPQAGTIVRVFATGASQVLATAGPGMGGAALGPDGALYVARAAQAASPASPASADAPAMAAVPDMPGAILRADLDAGTVSTVHVGTGGDGLKAPTALVFDGHGDIWLTDATAGAIYCCQLGLGADRLGPDTLGPVTLGENKRARERLNAAKAGRMDQVASLAGAGPIALSADRATLYVLQPATRQITAYGIAGRGKLAMRRHQLRTRIVATVAGTDTLTAMATEAGGNLIVAGAAGLRVVGPGGRQRPMQALPDAAPTGLGFSGAHPATLFVTTRAATGATVLSISWPRAGLELRFD